MWVCAFRHVAQLAARHGEPIRTTHRTPSTNMRLSRPVELFW
jgi:hypothetical protein